MSNIRQSFPRCLRSDSYFLKLLQVSNNKDLDNSAIFAIEKGKNATIQFILIALHSNEVNSD